MRGHPQFSFWISITLVEICFSRIFSKPRKNAFELVSTVLNDNSSSLCMNLITQLDDLLGLTLPSCSKANTVTQHFASHYFITDFCYNAKCACSTDKLYLRSLRTVPTKGSSQNYYTRTGPTKPQNRWWCLPSHPLLNVKRWYYIA